MKALSLRLSYDRYLGENGAILEGNVYFFIKNSEYRDDLGFFDHGISSALQILHTPIFLTTTQANSHGERS
jgi:hypothetical protein